MLPEHSKSYSPSRKGTAMSSTFTSPLGASNTERRSRGMWKEGAVDRVS